MTDSALAPDIPADYVFNPFAEGFTDDPYPHYAELRAAAPVHKSPLGFWILSEYEDVSALLRSGHSARIHRSVTHELPGMRTRVPSELGRCSC